LVGPYAAFLVACLVIIVPGPTVTLMVANGLCCGRREGLLKVAGTQRGRRS
jgi:threonine/homoserine/homoserine lactone efflux protein